MKLAGFLSFGAAFGAVIAALNVRGAPVDDFRHQRRQRAAEVLQKALRATEDRRLTAAVRDERLRFACSEAIDLLPAESVASARLAALLRGGDGPAPETAVEERGFRATMAEIASVLAFRPLIEAELPRGFPPPTPVGELELKQYPAYRMAQTDSASGNDFWTLFQHIKNHIIKLRVI